MKNKIHCNKYNTGVGTKSSSKTTLSAEHERVFFGRCRRVLGSLVEAHGNTHYAKSSQTAQPPQANGALGRSVTHEAFGNNGYIVMKARRLLRLQGARAETVSTGRVDGAVQSARHPSTPETKTGTMNLRLAGGRVFGKT